MVPIKDSVTGVITFVKEQHMAVISSEQADKILAEQPKIPNAPQDKDDVIGEDYDPYGHIDGSGYDQYTDIHTPYIPFHNYRQIHVALNGLFTGYNATRPLPKCPAFWGDVSHYWDFSIVVGYGTYEAIRVFGGLVVAAITMYAASKGIVAL